MLHSRAALALLAAASLSLPAAGQQLVDATATHFPPSTGEYTNHVAAGDLDGDGDLDLVFANGGDFSSAGPPQQQRVYINDGSGHFTDQTASRLSFFGICRGVTLGDFDVDGDLDIVFAQDFNRRPALFRNNGSGIFTDFTVTYLPTTLLSSSRAQFVDVDNDGYLDIFFVNASGSRFGCGQFRLYMGQIVYTDQTATRLPVENVCQPMDVALADVDGDFDVDIRTAGRGTNTSRLYLNNGSGVFTTVAGMPADSTAYSYDFGDVDGDGDLDLLGANAQPGGSAENLLRNDGNATFVNISGNLTPANAGQDDNDSKFFDYDNDGDLDVILAQIGGPEKVYQNNGSGVFTQVSGVIQAINDSSLEVLVADLTGDGRLDVVTAQGESGSFVNRIYVNNGPADTRPPRILDTERDPELGLGGAIYVVRALIVDDVTGDRNFFSDEIELDYRTDGGRWQTMPMVHSGGQVYRAFMPANAGTVFEYFVQATDRAGNTATGPTLRFTVGGETPIFADGFETGNSSRWSSTLP